MPFKKIKRSLFIKGANFIRQNIFRKSTAYDKANEKMLSNLKAREELDGEITFFATDPNIEIKGVGSGLLRALESRLKGKAIYVFTDKDCNYKFYERRGYSLEEEESVVVDTGQRQVPLTCYIYMKKNRGVEDFKLKEKRA